MLRVFRVRPIGLTLLAATAASAMLAWLFLSLAPARAAVRDPATPIPLAQFVDGIGVNTHLIYSDSDYNRFADVVTALKYIGVRQLRDAAPFAGNANQANLDRAAAAGLRFSFIMALNAPIPSKLDDIAGFLARHPGSVAAIEGLNEINNVRNFSYAGATGAAGGVAYQNALYDAVRSRPAFADVAVFNTTGPPLGARTDFVNIHSYPGDGAQPFSRLERDIGFYRAALPGKPFVITEGGYHTALAKVGGVAGVDEPTQGRLDLTFLFDAAQFGSARTYLYQLLDAYADPAGVKMERHFGLFDHAFRAKPAAVALHNLMAALNTRLLTTNDPAATRLPVAVSSGDADVASLQIARPDGVRAVILYRRARLWDAATKRPVYPRPAKVAIQATGFSVLTLHSPMTSERISARTNFTGRTALQLGANPIVAVLHPQ